MVLETRRSKGVLPEPTTVMGPGMTAEPLKYVRKPRDRRGSSCLRMTGRVVAPSDLTSMRRVSETAGLVSKIPLVEALVVVELN